MKTSRLRILPLLVIILTLVGCAQKKETTPTATVAETIAIPSAHEAIKERGDTLVALMVHQSASYFMWKGHVLGYEYDMLKKFAAHQGLKLEIKIVDNVDSLYTYLNRGDGDLAAFSMAVTNERRQEVDFTQRLFHSPKVLVQKKPSNWHALPQHKISNSLIRNILDIEQKPVYVKAASANYERLLKLGNEIGDSLNIIPVDSLDSDFDLIELVAKGLIDYTIADQEIAGMYASYHGIIDYETPVSMPQKKAWAVRKNSPQLLEELNAWLEYFKRYKEFYFIYDKYFNNPNTYRKIAKSPYSSRTGKLSQYDELIKTEAQKLNWDWRLLAAQIYQESNFNQSLTSWMGATGLMQVMPSTADMHGFKNMNHAPTNIKAGVAHLKYIDKKFNNLDAENHMKFTLASYNVGVGHIYDAQRLASHLGLNPNIWDNNVAKALLLKSERKYYQLDICRNGYCRGSEPYNYVNEILERFENYKRLVD